ncbi:MAG: LamG-like jellyroll fold domain-containing protein, partial [Cyclobacteriaceae bacterium]
MQFKISAATGIGSGTRHFRYFGSLTFLLFLQFLICFSAYAQPPVASGDCSRNILEFDVSENTGTTAISGFDYAEGSFEAWVRKDNWSDPYDDALFSNGIGHAHANSFYISFHSGVGIHFRYGGGEDTGSVAAYASNTSTDTLAANSWHHIAATWENDGSSTTLAVYIDAQLISTVSTSTNLVLNTANPFGLGLGVVNYLYDFQGGAMAEVSVWNIVKTQTEIESDMDRILSGDDLGLIAYWPLNDTPGSATASNTIQATETLSLLDFSDAYTAWAPFPMEIEVSGERILSGDTHDFGSIDVNTSSGAIIFTLTNNGSYTITFEDDPITVLTGNDADQFVLDLSSTASSLASGASTTFTVSFDPTSEGTKNASLALTNTASCSDPYIINLSGSTTNNSAPVITLGDPLVIDEDSQNQILSGISITDADNADVRMTWTCTNGYLTIGNQSGLTYIDGNGFQNETFTFTGSVADINANALNDAIAFTPTPDYYGSATITITIDDNLSGGGLTDTEVLNVTVNPVNDAPVITMGDDPTIDEDAVNAYMPAITVEDTDIGSASMRVTLSVTNGVLSTGANGGLIFINGDGSNDETITYTAPLSNVLTNLTSVAFTPTPDYNGTATLTITVDDAENGGGLTDTETYTITINPVPDPEISYSGAGFQEAIENDGALTGSIIITIFDDIFQDDDTDNLLDVGSEVTIGNIPAGLTPVMTLNSSTEAVLSLTGNASSHQGTDDVADITFEFTDAAFTNSMVADVPNATGPASSELGIDFNNNPFLTYSGNGFTELVSNDGSLDGSLLIALEGDTFQDIDSDGTLDAESQVIVGNLPNGVTPRISILDQLNPGGEWMTANNIAGSWQDVTYGAGTFVAVAYSGDVMTSNDGETWTLQTKPFNGFWSGVTYGDGVFVAVANASSGEQVMTSPDGVSWTAQTTPEANHWNDVIYANGQFVAVAFSGTNRVMTSPDGVDWTLRTAAENNPWRSLAYGGGLFVAVAQDGSNQVMTSDDGISWASRSAASAQTWKSVVYGDGLFVAVSGDGGVMTSPDGLNWTMRTAAESNSWTGVIYANGRFVAVSYSGNSTIMTSLDGIDWSAEDDLGTQGWTSIASGEGKFVAVGADATSGIHSYTHSFYGLELTLEGKAENHQNAHDVADITFDFDNSAFTNTGAPQVINATGPASSELGVDFTDNPDNDDCANPETLTVFEPGLGVPTEGSTEFSALASASIPCTIAPNVRDVWYSFNSGESGQVIFKVQHDEAATIEGAIYTACETIHETDNPFGDGSTPSCATDFSEPLYIVLAPNTEYLVRVWSPDEGKGDFTIMLEENLPPAIDEIVDKEVNEEQQLQFTVAATDDFVPDGQIEFFLQEESTGLGMSINASGEFSWTPGEDQDGSYEVTVIASDYFDFLTGFASYSTETFNITVNEVNTAPELGSVTAQDVAPEGSVYYQITATDTDLPEQTLLFSVDQASMDKGMYVDESDYLSWTPQPEHYGTTNNVEVTVSDGDLSATATLVITVGKAGQEIFFDSPGNYTYGETYSISLYADGGDSGNEVEFTSSDENVISISGSYANIIGAGEATIYANQAGNGNYNAAPEVSQTITISKADQYLSFDTPGSYTYGETATFELSAYGGDSGNPVVFTSSDDNVISISGSTATIEGAGDVTIYADQDGNGNYNPAEQQSAYMSIYKADQYIIFDYFDSKTYGDEPFEISATGGASTSPVVFTSSNESVVTVSGTTVTIVGAGDATIYANQAGDNNYNAAYEESQSVYVDKAEQLLIFEPISDKTFGGGTFELSATGGGSPNPVVFNTYDEGVIQISGSTVSIVGAGNATIYASQAGDDSYYQANEEYQYFEVFKATQEIVFDPIETKIQGDPAFALPEFSSVGLPITYDVDEGFIAYVDENIITITGSGSTTITAYQYGDDNYLEASPVQQTLNVEELWIWTGSWNNGFPPSSDDNARLDADFTFAGEMSFEVNNLTVSPNVTLAVAPENTLEVMGDLDNKGTMLIESGASLITYAASSVLGNDITIRRNTRYANGKYSFVGTPVMQSATMTTSNLGAHVYTYDESQSDVVEDLSRWVSASEADQLMPGQGYTQANQQLIEFAGVPNTGTITYSGSYQNDGWHLVSNPYAAAIDIDNFLDANTNTTGAIYIWDDNDSQTGRGTNDDYIVANKTAVTDISGPDNQSRWNGHIGSAQGFFVQLDGAEGNVTFTEGMRVHNNNSDDNYFRAAEISILRLNLISTDGLTKQAIVGWNETVSDEELVSGYDAPAFNLNADYAIYTEKANEYLTIQTITSQRLEIPVGFNVAEAGYYSLDFVKENLSADLYLYDNQTDEHVDISLGSYSFYTEAGQIRDRFVLVRKSKTLDLSQITTNIYAYNKILTIETNRSQPAAYRLFDLSGHEVLMAVITGPTVIDLNHLSNGVY